MAEAPLVKIDQMPCARCGKIVGGFAVLCRDCDEREPTGVCGGCMGGEHAATDCPELGLGG